MKDLFQIELHDLENIRLLSILRISISSNNRQAGRQLQRRLGEIMTLKKAPSLFFYPNNSEKADQYYWKIGYILRNNTKPAHLRNAERLHMAWTQETWIYDFKIFTFYNELADYFINLNQKGFCFFFSNA